MEVKEAAERYTYADYAKWDDDVRRELIDGAIYLMSPAPTLNHQRILRKLSWQLENFLRGKPCELFVAPCDVCLNAAGDDDKTVVQPDIFVVCDKSKLDGKRCNGAPDMIVEILSPSSKSRDMLIKFSKYLEAGVREYWIVDPADKTTSVCLLKDREYIITDYSEGDTISVNTLKDCKVDMSEVFEG